MGGVRKGERERGGVSRVREGERGEGERGERSEGGRERGGKRLAE